MKERIKQVSKDFLNNYVENWAEKKELPSKCSLIYCKDGNKYVGVDNTTNDCWVEEFDNEKDVRRWLLGIEKEDIVSENNKVERDAR